MPIVGSTDEITAWMNVAGSKPVLTKEEVCILARKIRSEKVNSPRYKFYVNKLVSHNLRLVIRSVHLYMNGKSRRNWGETDTLDFLQTGTLGLIRAAEKYDPETGYTFATYATYWIRSFIGRYAIKTSSIFHIPENACRDAFAFEKHGFIRNKSHDVGKEFTKLVRSAQSVLSLDMPLGEDGDTKLGDCLESRYAVDTSANGSFSSEMRDLIEAADLSEQQVQILEHLFIHEMKLKDVIKVTALSKRQVTMLRESAFSKLKRVMTTVKSKDIM